MTRDEMLTLEMGDRVRVDTSDPTLRSVFTPTVSDGTFVGLATVEGYSGPDCPPIALVLLDTPHPAFRERLATFNWRWLSRVAHAT